MKVERIEVDPFKEIIITAYEGTKQINDHGIMNIYGYFPINKKEDYINLAKKTKLIKVTGVSYEGENQILLFGNLTKFELSIENNFVSVFVEVKTGSYLMDLKIHTRLFQDTSITYRKVLEICNETYVDCNTIMMVGKDEKISDFVVQYKETDWEFIKRLASHLQAVVVPDTQTGGVKYYFGLPRWRKEQIKEFESYKICRDCTDYQIKKQNGIGISEENAILYEVVSRELYDVGALVDFLDKELYVIKVASYFKGSELYHTYYLKQEIGLKQIQINNNKLIGASLLGQVISIKNDKVQVKVFEDESKESNDYNRWYPFSTIYSSPDGTGWYCMPERGDTIRLSFPTDNAEQAYVSSAVHEYSGERTEPEKKRIKNRQGKEICLAPDYISMTNNNGIYLELSDDTGIIMKSNGSILLNAKERVYLSSENAEVILKAVKAIYLQQGENSIKLSDSIAIEGKSVRLH